MAEKTDELETAKQINESLDQELEDSQEWGAEEKRLRAIRERRRKAKECVMCGKPLGFWDKRAGREQHEKCTTWHE